MNSNRKMFENLDNTIEKNKGEYTKFTLQALANLDKEYADDWDKTFENLNIVLKDPRLNYTLAEIKVELGAKEAQLIAKQNDLDKLMAEFEILKQEQKQQDEINEKKAQADENYNQIKILLSDPNLDDELRKSFTEIIMEMEDTFDPVLRELVQVSSHPKIAPVCAEREWDRLMKANKAKHQEMQNLQIDIGNLQEEIKWLTLRQIELSVTTSSESIVDKEKVTSSTQLSNIEQVSQQFGNMDVSPDKKRKRKEGDLISKRSKIGFGLFLGKNPDTKSNPDQDVNFNSKNNISQ